MTNDQDPPVADQLAVLGDALPPVDPPAAPKERWRSEDLLGDRREILIQHGNEIYRLRRTRQGKLILHK